MKNYWFGVVVGIAFDDLWNYVAPEPVSGFDAALAVVVILSITTSVWASKFILRNPRGQ